MQRHEMQRETEKTKPRLGMGFLGQVVGDRILLTGIVMASGLVSFVFVRDSLGVPPVDQSLLWTVTGLGIYWHLCPSVSLRGAEYLGVHLEREKRISHIQKTFSDPQTFLTVGRKASKGALFLDGRPSR